MAHERYERRKAERVPWIESPLRSSDEEWEEFSQREESSKIELFYDLFFVANLTSLTKDHEVHDEMSLTSYAGFFAIIWTTWLQVALFDVRFAVASTFERTCKVVQLTTMIGFASVGPEFNPDGPQNPKVFKTLTVLLLVSRGLLAIQYAIAMKFIAGKRKGATRPLLFIVLTFAITSAVYLGLFFAFNTTKQEKKYYIWYVFIAVELLAVMGVSVRWRLLCFKRTHLPERLGLLTLIILGEGVMVLTKSVNYVVGADGWTTMSFGQVFVMTLTIYFLWELYFDNHPAIHFGTIRQQIWCILHFPFHLCLVLLLEGINNFVLYHDAIHQFISVYVMDNQIRIANVAEIQSINDTIASFGFDDSPAAHMLPDIYTALNRLSTLTSAPEDQQGPAIDDLLTRILAALFEKFGFSAPKSARIAPTQSITQSTTEVIRAIYKYFFASAGMVMFLLAVFLWFVRRGMDTYEKISFGIRLFAAAILFSCIPASSNGDILFNYLSGPWILATLLMVLLLVFAVDRAANWVAIMKGKERYDSQATPLSGIIGFGNPSQDKAGAKFGDMPYSPEVQPAQK